MYSLRMRPSNNNRVRRRCYDCSPTVRRCCAYLEEHVCPVSQGTREDDREGEEKGEGNEEEAGEKNTGGGEEEEGADELVLPLRPSIVPQVYTA